MRAFIQGLEWSRLPPEVKQAALDLFSDWFANAVAGFDSPLARALASLSPIYNRPGRALRAGDLQAAEPLWAALINASAVHALEYDDSYRAGLYHPGAPVIAVGAFSAACRQEEARNRASGGHGGRLRNIAAPGFGRQPVALQTVAHHRYRRFLWRSSSCCKAFRPRSKANCRLHLVSPGHRLPDSGRFCRMPRKPRICIRPRRPTRGSLSALLAKQGIRRACNHL